MEEGGSELDPVTGLQDGGRYGAAELLLAEAAELWGRLQAVEEEAAMVARGAGRVPGGGGAEGAPGRGPRRGRGGFLAAARRAAG